GPHPRLPAGTEEVPRLVAGDLQAGRAHPTGRELVRCVLLRGVGRPMPRDGVHRLEPLHHAHSANARRTPKPASGSNATTRKPRRQDVAPTKAPNAPG